jgi:hypothetical protein
VRAPPAVAVGAEVALHRPAVAPAHRERQRRLGAQGDAVADPPEQLRLHPEHVPPVLLRLEVQPGRIAANQAVRALQVPGWRERVGGYRVHVQEDRRRIGRLRRQLGDDPLAAPRLELVGDRAGVRLAEVARFLEGQRHRGGRAQRLIGGRQPAPPERCPVQAGAGERGGVLLVRRTGLEALLQRLPRAAGGRHEEQRRRDGERRARADDAVAIERQG